MIKIIEKFNQQNSRFLKNKIDNKTIIQITSIVLFQISIYLNHKANLEDYALCSSLYLSKSSIIK